MHALLRVCMCVCVCVNLVKCYIKLPVSLQYPLALAVFAHTDQSTVLQPEHVVPINTLHCSASLQLSWHGMSQTVLESLQAGDSSEPS